MISFYILTVIKLVIGFVILIGYLNLSGKRRLSEMSPLNFIGNFIIGGTVSGAIYGNVPIFEYILIMVLSLAILYIIDLLAKKISFVKEASIGHPIVIVKHGKLLIDVMNDPKNKVNLLNLARRLRVKGIYTFNQLYYLQIETDGELTIIKSKDEMPSWMLVNDGEILKYELTEIGKTEDWLLEEAKQRGIEDIKEVYFAQWYQEQLTFTLKDGTQL